MNQAAAAAQVINTRAEGPTYTMGPAAARPGPCSTAGAAAVMDGPALANMSSTISAQTECSWCCEGGGGGGEDEGGSGAGGGGGGGGEGGD